MSLRPGLLDGRRIALLSGSAEIAAAYDRLGAQLERLGEESAADDDQVGAWIAARSPLHALLYDARGSFAPGGHSGLRRALDGAWVCARSLATAAFIPGPAGGRLLFLAPSPEAGALAEAARSGLESLARTLSVEWARYGVTAVAICPVQGTGETELAELTAYLLSPAGGYFTGCRFDFGPALIDAS